MYGQLNEDMTFSHFVPNGILDWDDTHRCTVQALTEYEKTYFRIVDVVDLGQPAFDPLTHTCARDSAELVDGQWQRAYILIALTQDQMDAAFQATVPQSVTMRQAQLELLNTPNDTYGNCLDAADAAISGMTGIAGRAAQIEWTRSSAVLRHEPLVGAMAYVLGLSSLQVDHLFIAASKR